MGAPVGNRNAIKGKLWEQALTRAARPKDLQEIAETVIAAAKEGQAWAITELGNRLDGKPVQQVDMSGELSMTKTYRDLGDDVLAQIAGRALPDQGETVQ